MPTGYFELNPALTIEQPAGIVMMIGTFDLWFGNANGSALRKWCIERGWPLAWAHNPLDSLWRCGVNTSTGGDCTPPQRTFAVLVARSSNRVTPKSRGGRTTDVGTLLSGSMVPHRQTRVC